MTPEQVSQVTSAHAAALDLPISERRGYLAQLFDGDAVLLDEALDLLRRSEEAGDFLNAPPFRHLARPDACDLIPARIGPYQLIDEIGHGGFASVYRARRDDLPEHVVAIKVLNRLSHAREAFLRFRREIQILATLRHPYVVRFHDAGTTDEAVAYIVTEYVEGKHIDDFSAQRPLETKLRLMLRVCEGVAAAHQHLIVHRDIKPSNILVTEDGTPKLLDFGIATVLKPDSRITKTGVRCMTERYASPEQLRGDPEISTVADVYALGILLKEICLDPPRDLGAIISKACGEAPESRYQSVDLLREDLVRLLDGQPVVARGKGITYRAGKFLRKHWAGVVGFAGAFLALAILSAISWREADRASRRSSQVERLLTQGFDQVGRYNESLGLRQRRSFEMIRLSYIDPLPQELKRSFVLQVQRFGSLRAIGIADGLPASLNLGETEAARRSLEKAAVIGQELIRWPEGSAIVQDVALTEIELGTVLLEEGKAQDAARRFAEADALASRYGKHREALEALAQKSRMLVLQRRGKEALDLRQQVIQGRRELYRKNPRGLRWEFAGALCSYGELLRKVGRLADAERAYGEALPLIEEYAREFPAGLDRRWHLARESEEYGKVLADLGRTAAASRQFARSIGMYRGITLGEPDAESNRRALAVCLAEWGSLLARAGEREQGEQLIREGLALSEAAAKHDPASARAQAEVASIRASLLAAQL